MDHPDVVVKPMQYLRDARAITASYVRKFPQTSYLDSILPGGWFYASFMAMKLPEDRSRFPVFYYEDCQRDPLGFLARVGPYLGLSYTDKALRFWEWDHHITAGNGGTIWLVKMAKGLEPTGFKDAQFYGERLEALKRNPIGAFVDERWKTELGRLERFYFDVVLGAKHQELGFERDRFEMDDVRSLLDEHNRLASGGGSTALPPPMIAAYLGQREMNGLSTPDRARSKRRGSGLRLIAMARAGWPNLAITTRIVALRAATSQAYRWLAAQGSRLAKRAGRPTPPTCIHSQKRSVEGPVRSDGRTMRRSDGPQRK